MKKFEELEILVRRLDNYKEVKITLPSSDPIEELEIALTDEDSDDIYYEFEEDEIEIVKIEDTSGLFNKFSSSKNMNIDELNSIAVQLIEFSEDEVRKILAINEAQGLKLEELSDIDLENGYCLYEDTTLEDYYYSLVEDGAYSIERLINYIDFESFAKDQNATYDNGLIETKYGLLVG